MSEKIIEKATRLKEDLIAGRRTVVVGWNAIAAGMVIDALAARFDLVSVDLQHGLVDFAAAADLVSYTYRFETPAVCRVPSTERGLTSKLLDAGFLGVIGPMIETEDDARALVRASAYPPLGERSYGPIRARRVYGNRYGTLANDAVMRVAMVETQKGLENLDAILSVDGIDGIYIGPSDLALSMGLPPAGSELAEVADAIEQIRRRSIEAGKFAGIHCGDGPSVQKHIDQGFSFIGLSGDINLLEHGIDQQLKDIRSKRAATGRAEIY